MRNEALITILKNIEQDYPIKYLTTNRGISLNNMWFSAMKFAEGRSNTSSFDLAAIMLWIKETYPEKFEDLLKQIFEAFSDPENPTPLLELQNNLYNLYLRTFNMAELTSDKLTAIIDEHNVGCGAVIIDLVMANLWTPSETTLDPGVAKSIVDVLPDILELNSKFEKLPDDFFSSWSDPLHPKLSFLEGYLEERKNRIDHTISSLLKNKQVAVEIFMRAMENPSPNIWETITERYSDAEQQEYIEIAKVIIESEHLFMNQFSIAKPDDTDLQRQQKLRDNLSLARTVYLDSFNTENHFGFMINALLSTMTEGYSYLYNKQPIANQQDSSIVEEKITLPKTKEGNAELEQSKEPIAKPLDSSKVREKLTLPNTKEGNAEFKQFIAAIEVVKAEPKKGKSLKS